jgi:delta 1-pyrroline-5-carboxylate dehydrogenase
MAGLPEPPVRGSSLHDPTLHKAVVPIIGWQPFGGGRSSGTNDKAGTVQNLLRWATARAMKETFVPPHRHEYHAWVGKPSKRLTNTRCQSDG